MYGTHNTLYRLDNTYVELLAADAGASSPLSAVVRDAQATATSVPAAWHSVCAISALPWS